MKKILLVLVASFSFLSAQTHIVPEGFSGISVSFKHDQNVDFFGEGKFLRDSYENAIGFGYIYNGTVGIDLAYGYSLNNKKDVVSINQNQYPNLHFSIQVKLLLCYLFLIKQKI